MTAQEYLEQAQQLDRQIDSKSMQLQRLRELSTKTTGTISDDVVSHTRNVHSLEDVMAAIIDMEEEINLDLARAFDLKKEIARTINSLEDVDERQVLDYRYLCYLPWNEISERMGCSERTVFRLHAEALKKISMFSENWQSVAVAVT